MRVFVTGGSSFLGEFLLSNLVGRGVDVVAGVRSEAARRRVERLGAEPVALDMEQYSAPHVKADVLIHGAGMRFAAQAVHLAHAIAASRFVCISSASVAVRGHPLSASLAEYEGIIRTCGRETTIVRPTMIFGGSRDNNVRVLYRAIQRLPTVPRFVGGEAVQPVFVDDLCGVLAEIAISQSRPQLSAMTYGGPTSLLLGDIVGDVTKRLNRFVLPISISVRLLARVAQGTRLDKRSRSAHALSMLLSHRGVPDPRDFGFSQTPTTWSDALDLAAARYEGQPAF